MKIKADRVKIEISIKDLTKLFWDNPNLKHKDNILYFKKLKGGLKNGTNNTGFK